MERDFDVGNVKFRGRLRLTPNDCDGNRPSVSTPGAIENAARNLRAGWPAYEGMFRPGNLCMPPSTPFMRCALEGVLPLHIFARGPNDLVTAAFEAYRASGVYPRKIQNAQWRTRIGDRAGRFGGLRLARRKKVNVRRNGVCLRPSARGEGADSNPLPLFAPGGSSRNRGCSFGP